MMWIHRSGVQGTVLVPGLIVLGMICRRPLAADAVDTRSSAVGMPAQIEQIVIPGPELAVRPVTDRGPLIVRIVNTFPHGTDFRYDIEYYGLEPGTYDLSRFLERRDGTPATGLPAIEVTITTLLPPGQVQPNALTPDSVHGLGGYQMWMITGAAVWAVGLFCILFAGRARRTGIDSAPVEPESLASRLRPIVEQAIAGELPAAKLAELEMMLVAFWRKRLHHDQSEAAEVIPKLRNHPEAGPLLRQLEAWLHQPETGSEVDVPGLLAPYRHLAADALPELSPD